MAINAPNPVVVPSTSEVVYDKARVSLLQVFWQDGAGPMRGVAEVRKCKDNPDGSFTDAPNVPGAKAKGTIVIQNLWEKAATDPELGQIILALATKVVAIAQEEGVI